MALKWSAVIALGCTAAWVSRGCGSPEQRYQVLSFFFDGVPDPNAAASTQPGGGGRTAAGGLGPNVPIYTHKPYGEQNCAACHSGSADIYILTTDSNVCMKCHAAIPTAFRVMHGPVALKACLFCHNPHESTIPHLLKAPPPGICTQCHSPQFLGPIPPEHEEPNSPCLDCHFGHGGPKRYMLRKEVTEVPSGRQVPSLGKAGT